MDYKQTEALLDGLEVLIKKIDLIVDALNGVSASVEAVANRIEDLQN